MKKSKPEADSLMVCPACAGKLRDSIDVLDNLFQVWCPSPCCVAPMNLGTRARTIAEAVAALKAKHTA